MSNYFFVTGSSQGIGKALCELLLENPNNQVIGLSRNQTISHQNYKHFEINFRYIQLLDIDRIFLELEKPQKIVLVNNAAILGNIKYVGENDKQHYLDLININITTPFLLMETFLKKYQNFDCQKVILNVSSGAGKRPIDGWAGYCASKAALDLFSQNVSLEQKIRQKNVYVYSVSPSVVATQMQAQIRETNTENFSNVAHFKNLHQQNQLLSPHESAQKILKIIQNPENFKESLQDVRNI